jgi:hypothetical protein
MDVKTLDRVQELAQAWIVGQSLPEVIKTQLQGYTGRPSFRSRVEMEVGLGKPEHVAVSEVLGQWARHCVAEWME